MKLTEAQRRAINNSIDDMLRHQRSYADLVGAHASTRKALRARGLTVGGWIISHLTYGAFEAVGRVDDYMTMLVAQYHEMCVAAGLEIRR